ncbi:MAG: class I SAM-dependent methyltransferase [Rhodobacteraceae bacterium]|nr:class I SAM-dependent methyltransferase [Paracoccaceae bacterium]
MVQARLSLALTGDGALPRTGEILVLGPRAGTLAGVLPQDRCTVVQGFRPDHDRLQSEGWKVIPALPEGGRIFDAALIVLPRAKAEGRGMVAAAVQRCAEGAPIWIDGQKTDGADTMIRDLRPRVAITPPLAKAHGKIFRFDRSADAGFEDWQAQELSPAPGFVTLPGMFSADRIDPGSRMLADALPDGLAGRVADLGAGWGWLSSRILLHQRVSELHLVEADFAALAAARRNVTDPRARFHWADVTGFAAEKPFDAVVMNPPFHTGRAAEPGLGVAFIETAARILAPTGRLLLVANRHLPYETALSASFASVDAIGGDSAFKLLRAVRPLRKPRPRG